jgi:hypothetical protein
MFQIVPHHVTECTVEVFCGAFLGDEPPPRATLSLRAGASCGCSVLTENDWLTLSGDGESSIHHARRTISGLQAGFSYEIELTDSDGALLASGVVDTLPAHLPDGDNGSGPNRPLTIWLSSCFYSPKAPSGLEEMVRGVVRDARTRPHLKVLAGDQVYVDYPQSKTLFFGEERLRQHFNDVYTATWTHPAFAELLRTGASYFLIDDHEFWDNYPDNPVPLLWALRGEGFWRTWQDLALERCKALQSVAPSQRIDIGPKAARELSIFLAQTRLERSKGPFRILTDASMVDLETWIANLNCPGVLVVTQPVVSRSGEPDDWNLQDYRQFRERLRPALEAAKYDIVVLAGDPHFGRVAVVDFGGHRLVEVVASPLTLVTPQAGASRAATPPTFPTYGPMVERSPVSYPQVVPSYESGSWTLAEEHAMLLSFCKVEGGVQLRVGLHLARQDTPADEWHWETTLKARSEPAAQ